MTELQEHKVRRRRSREEAAQLVLEYEQSGLTRQAFCRRHGVSLATLDNYRQRSVSVGAAVRRNWLHLGSKEAGSTIAAIFSIVESCRKLGVPIRQYLADVLPGMADRSIHSLADLTPTACAAKPAN